MSPILSSVSNALKILKKFSSEQPVVYVSLLAEELNLSKSTISRLIQTLVSEGFLEKDKNSTGYRLSYTSLALSGLLLSGNEVYYEVMPVLSELVVKTKENAHLTILNDFNVIYLAKLPGHYYSELFTGIGKMNPAHATSSGKVLLSGLKDRDIDEYLKGDIKAFTKNTIVNPLQFKDQLMSIRKKGYAISIGELNESNLSIAAPVYNYEGQMVCAISIAGPISRINQKKIEEYKEVVLEAASEASGRLGYDEIEN